MLIKTNTQQAHPDRLFLITGALASKILMDGKRVFGVEFLQGENLYEADTLYNPSFVPSIHRIFASIIMLGEKAGDVIVEHAHRPHWEND